MAINYAAEFPTQIATPTANYPYGSGQNVTVSGDDTGTPWDPVIFNDWIGFFGALLGQAGNTPNGVPDNVNSSQYLDSLKTVIAGEGYGDFLADGSVPMTGDLDAGGNSANNLGLGNYGPVGTTVLSASFNGDPDTGITSLYAGQVALVANITNFSTAPIVTLDATNGTATIGVGSYYVRADQDTNQRLIFRAGTSERMYLYETELDVTGLPIKNVATPVDATDAANRQFVLDNAGGVGDFLADGSVPMTGTLQSTLGNDDTFAQWGNMMVTQNSGGETVLGRMPAATYQSWFKLTGSTASMRSGASSSHSTFTVREDYAECNNNIRVGGSALNALLPIQNNDLIRKDFFDQNAGAGDFLADGSVPMTGKINIDSAVVGGFEHDGTIKMQVAATSVSFSPVSSTVLTITDTAVQLSNSADLIAQKNVMCTEFVTSGSTTLDAKPPTANNALTRKDWTEKTFQAKPAAIAGFTAAQYYKVTPEDPTPLDVSEFDGAVGVSVSIGPTGSGAGVVWPALDALPLSALSVTVMFTLAYIDSTIAGDVQFNVTIPPGGVGTRALIRQKSGTDEAGFTITQIDIPLSATNVLNLTSLVTNSSINGVNLTFVGFHDAQ